MNRDYMKPLNCNELKDELGRAMKHIAKLEAELAESKAEIEDYKAIKEEEVQYIENELTEERAHSAKESEKYKGKYRKMREDYLAALARNVELNNDLRMQYVAACASMRGADAVREERDSMPQTTVGAQL
jgi:multidrug resistance efflux pump